MKTKPKILIVDDEINVCKSIASALEDQGYIIDTALSGEEGLNKHSENKYDLIVADLMMPDITGIELLKRVKEKTPNVQFIVVTGYPSIKTAVEAIKLGAFDYIPKPFTPDELRSLVNRALQYYSMEKPELKPIPADYYCIIDNCWAKIEGGGNVRIGVHERLIKDMKEIAMLELPNVGEIRYQGEACARITTIDNRTFRIWTPVSGKIIAINEGIYKELDKLTNDPYYEGWLILLKPTNLDADLKNLVKC